MSDGTLTVAERIRRIETDVAATLALATELTSRDRADLERFGYHETRIAKLEAWQTWVMRLIAGTVITGIVGAGLIGAAFLA